VIYSLEAEPRRSVLVYEWQYNRWFRRWHYKWSSPNLTFPVDAVPISGRFESGFFIPDVLKGTADVNAPPNGKIECYMDINERNVCEKSPKPYGEAML
jgi:hypothetical protein